jgi:hypothetical protein
MSTVELPRRSGGSRAIAVTRDSDTALELIHGVSDLILVSYDRKRNQANGEDNRLSATGVRFLLIPCPLGSWAFLTVG